MDRHADQVINGYEEQLANERAQHREYKLATTWLHRAGFGLLLFLCCAASALQMRVNRLETEVLVAEHKANRYADLARRALKNSDDFETVAKQAHANTVECQGLVGEMMASEMYMVCMDPLTFARAREFVTRPRTVRR